MVETKADHVIKQIFIHHKDAYVLMKGTTWRQIHKNGYGKDAACVPFELPWLTTQAF